MFFCSDFHFAHKKPFIYEARGFSSPEEHDESLILNFNSVVGVDDTTVFAGDFSFNKKRIVEFFNRLNGQFILVYGNHDQGLIDLVNSHALDGKVLASVQGFLETVIDNHPVTVSHFAMRSWPKSHFNSWHLYGHHHYPTDFGGKTLNITVDCHKCFPWSEVDISKAMAQAPSNWDFIYKE